MHITHLSNKAASTFNLDNSIKSYQEKLNDEFKGLPFTIKNFEKQIQLKQNSYNLKNREVLCQVLNNTYKHVHKDQKLQQNLIDLKKSNTFTITTGHQLNLFLGPAYFFYKIIHVIAICDRLVKEYPKYNFVPVFWMASEDHDYEEIKSTSIFGKKLTWETDQIGCVGDFCFDSQLQEIVKQFKALFQNSNKSDIYNLIDSYQGNTLSEATFNFLNALFGEKGLVVLDPNNKKLKRLSKNIFIKELTEMPLFKLVNKTNKKLIESGLKTQAFVREINLFFIENGTQRTRIIKEDNLYKVGEKKYTKKEILEIVENSPECFSPNVLLRPLYQELILPNLCYIGGEAENKYWMQLKSSFDANGIIYPILGKRKSILYLNKSIAKKINKIGLPLEAFFLNETQILEEFLLQNNSNINWEFVDASFSAYKEIISNAYKKLDTSLISSLNAEFKKITKSHEAIKKRINKENKNRYTVVKSNIQKVKSSFFPDDSFQERSLHFFNFCAEGDLQLLTLLNEKIEPFNESLLIVNE